MSDVTIRGLHIRYGKTEAVRGLDLDIPAGAIVGFIGPNGAGKTSTIKCMATLVKPFAGSVRVGGHDVAQDPAAVRRVIGYVPDSFGVYDDLTVREYLHFFAAAQGIPGSRRLRLVDDVLALTDLAAKIDAPVEGLSRGMKQRLSISRVLLHDPALLLLDEPASGLDPRARIELRELLKELQRLGKTIVVSSHILHELAQLCSRIAIIDHGKLVAEGALEDIWRTLGLLRLVLVEVANPGEALTEAARRIPGVESVEPSHERLAIRIHEGGVALEDLHAGLVAAGARIRGFQAEAMDMESAFLALTRGATHG
jgi:ABC-2 type transport system ATP-binding protein